MRSLRPSRSAPLFALSVFVAALGALTPACGGLVVYDGGEGGAGGSSSSTPIPSTSTGPAPVTTAVVTDEGGGRSTLRIANFGLGCAEPDVAPPYARCGWFDLEVQLPTKYLDEAFGEIDPYDDEVSSYFSAAGEPDGDGCSFGTGGGGDALFGRLVIVSADAASVEVELEGWDDFIGTPGADGTHRAERCVVQGAP